MLTRRCSCTTQAMAEPHGIRAQALRWGDDASSGLDGAVANGSAPRIGHLSNLPRQVGDAVGLQRVIIIASIRPRAWHRLRQRSRKCRRRCWWVRVLKLWLVSLLRLSSQSSPLRREPRQGVLCAVLPHVVVPRTPAVLGRLGSVVPRVLRSIVVEATAICSLRVGPYVVTQRCEDDVMDGGWLGIAWGTRARSRKKQAREQGAP